MPKSYSYLFSYYWKVSWEDENSFKNDTANYKGFKQRIKRECKVTLSNSVSLYLNLRWVTTLGRMQSLFPNANHIEVSSPEEFGTMKDAKEIKPIINRKTYKLRRVMEPSERFSYSLREIPTLHKQDRRANDKKVRIPIRLPKPQVLDNYLEQNRVLEPRNEIESLKKKVHSDLEDKGTVSTEYSSLSPKKPLDEGISPQKNAEMLEECEEKSLEYEDSYDIQERGLLEENIFPQHDQEEDEWRIERQDDWAFDEMGGDKFYAKRIKNIGIESSIDGLLWESNNPQIGDFDLV